MKKTFLKNLWRNYKASTLFTSLLLVVLLFFLRGHIHFFFAGVNVVCILSILILISKIKNKYISGFLTLLISFILSASISFAILFSSPLTLGNIASFFETNFSEINSFPFAFSSMFLGCLLLVATLLFRAKEELKDLMRVNLSVALLVIIILVINVFTILIPVRHDYGFIHFYRKDLKELPLQTIYAHSSIRSPLLYGDILGLAVYLTERREFERFKNLDKTLPKGVVLQNKEKSATKIYLVLGESAYRKRMSLYGYKIKTTPFLDSIVEADSSSIHFYEGISVANITRDAVRFSLSFATPFNKDAFWTEKNSIELARDAGYYTTWYSNQGLAGLYDNYPSYIAKSSNEVYFENELQKNDLNLLSTLKTYDGKGDKQLITFHLMGSHFPFSERYDEVDNRYFGDNDSISDYDKSIHHSDRFLRELYKYTVLNDESSIIIYFSDHGANPYRGVHGLLAFEESEFEIPFIILNNGVEIDIDSIVQQYISNGFVNNVNLAYILAHLMGYSVDETTRKKAQEDGENVMLVNGAILPLGLLQIVCF